MGAVPPGTDPYTGGGGGSKALGSQISGGMGGLASILGLISSIGQQNAEAQAISQTGQQLTGALGTLQSQGGQLYSQYQNTAAPALANIIATAPGQAAQYQAGAGGMYGLEGAYGSQLAASPYPGMIQGEGGLFRSLPAGSIADQYANAAALQNWQGLQPKELGQATTVASNAALTAANTMKAQMGGVPNAGAAYKQATTQAAQTGMDTALGLGSMAQQQELQAKMAAGQEYGQIAGEQLQQAAGTVGATEAAGQAYQGALTGGGQLVGAAGQGFAGLSEQELQLLESAIGTEASMGQAGMGAGEYAASDWASVLESELGLQGGSSGSSSPFSQFASTAMQIAPLFMGA